MENKRIVDDGYLEKLDIPVAKGKIKMNPGLMAMELPSSVRDDFTVEDVENCLREFAKVAHKQLVDHCAKHNIDYERRIQISNGRTTETD